MRIDVIQAFDEVVLTPVGRLEVSTAPRIATALGKHLAGHAPVLVDLSRLVLRHVPSVAVFPAARRAAGSRTPLALFGADPRMAAALRSSRVGRTVVIAADLTAARTAVLAGHGDDDRAAYCVPNLTRTGDVVRSACDNWGLSPTYREIVVAVAEEMVGPCGERGCDLTLRHTGHHLSVHVRDHAPFGGTADEERVAQVSLIERIR